MSSMLHNKRFLNILGLGVSILITFGVAAFASLFKPGEWYLTLTKPTWTPPGWIFGPVWGILYLSMSVSVWLIWKQRKTQIVKIPLTLYIVQLTLNGLWSWLFFGQQLIGIALIDILLLAAIIAVTIVFFRKISKTAGLLLMPYLLWVCFATALNFEIWRIN